MSHSHGKVALLFFCTRVSWLIFNRLEIRTTMLVCIHVVHALLYAVVAYYIHFPLYRYQEEGYYGFNVIRKTHITLPLDQAQAGQQ